MSRYRLRLLKQTSDVNCTIREVDTSKDTEQLHIMLKQLYAYERIFLHQEVMDSQILRNHLETGRRSALVAANPISDTLYGYIMFSKCFALELHGMFVYIEDLFVAENFRRYGIGKRMFYAVIRFCQQHKVKRLQWDVLAWNQAAVDFYVKSVPKSKNLGEVRTGWLTFRLDAEAISNFDANVMK